MRVLFTILLVALSAIAFCQPGSKWSMSLNAEYSASTLRNVHSPFAVQSYKGTAHKSLFYGLYAEYAATSTVSVVMGILRNERGTIVNYSSATVSSGYTYYEEFYRKIANQYWTLPLMARYYFPVQSGRLYAEAGPYIALRGNGIARGTDNQSTVTNNTQFPVYTSNATFESNDNSHTNKYDAGVACGAGYVLPLTERIFLNLNLRLWYSLRQVDGLYNNNIVNSTTPGGSQTSTVEDYYNLNSHAKYFAATAGAGLTVRL
jgi:Outer membrane protein beta-barrel domain